MTRELITTFEDEDEQILYGLDAWTQYLSIRDLPARASSIKRLKMLLQSDKSTTGQLEKIIKRDPVLTLAVVKAAQLKHNAHESAVKSILHAVTTLGYDGIELITQQVKPMSLNPTNVQQKRFLHALACSQHAACQLQEWMRLKKLPLIEESYLAALFYSLGFWSLWLHAPLHMQQIQKRIHEFKEPPLEVEFEVLGCSMQMISHNLAKSWQLSELTLQAQDHETSPSLETLKKLHQRALKDPNLEENEIRQLNHITQQKHFPIKLANWLALDALRDWYSEQTLRSIDLISDYLGTSIEKTLALVHSTCAKSSREYFAPGIISPACQLLFIPSALTVQFKMGAKEYAASLTAYPLPEIPMIRPIDISQFEDSYQDLSFYNLIKTHMNAGSATSKFTKPTQVLLALIQGLQRGLDIKRVALFSVSKKKNLVKVIQNNGFEQDHPMHDFSTNLSEGGILSDLSKKQSYVVYDKLRAAKLDPKIGSHLQGVAAAEFMLVSIFKVKQLVGIIYLDMHNSPLSNFSRERSRHLCYAASHAIENLHSETSP